MKKEREVGLHVKAKVGGVSFKEEGCRHEVDETEEKGEDQNLTVWKAAPNIEVGS